MVPTTSLTSDLDFSSDDLLGSASSGFHEDAELCNLLGAMVADLVKEITPIIIYIDHMLDGGTRGVIIARGNDGSLLGLSRKGDWIFGPSGGPFKKNEKAWEKFKATVLIVGLQHTLQEGVEKKKQHLKAVEARAEMLRQISNIVIMAREQRQ